MNEVVIIKKQPSIPEILRGIKVGKKRRIALVGSVYNAVHTAMTRLRRNGIQFTYEIDPAKNEMIITRVK